MASYGRDTRLNSASLSILLESEMGPILVIQVDNATHIALNREKSATLGILGQDRVVTIHHSFTRNGRAMFCCSVEESLARRF